MRTAERKKRLKLEALALHWYHFCARTYVGLRRMNGFIYLLRHEKEKKNTTREEYSESFLSDYILVARPFHSTALSSVCPSLASIWRFLLFVSFCIVQKNFRCERFFSLACLLSVVPFTFVVAFLRDEFFRKNRTMTVDSRWINNKYVNINTEKRWLRKFKWRENKK